MPISGVYPYRRSSDGRSDEESKDYEKVHWNTVTSFFVNNIFSVLRLREA